MITGSHLVAGEWRATKKKFLSSPASGQALPYSVGTPEIVEEACNAAEAAFQSYSALSRADRRRFLDNIAFKIECIGDDIVETAFKETGLPKARLDSELKRTAGQLRLFAKHIAEVGFLDLRHDRALPMRQPLPRPDLRMMQRAIGPVAVFGASNFPLAFSTAGGDTAAALAAACPVVVKGHSAHPGTGELVAQAVNDARRAFDLHPGVFSFIQGGDRTVGQALVTHPLIKAVGFTGSHAGGRALFNLCADRPEPIPFFGELGSINPVFVLPQALAHEAEHLAIRWAASLTIGAGQFCTNPGVVFLPKGQGEAEFLDAAKRALGQHGEQTMLTEDIAESFRMGQARIRDVAGVTEVVSSPSSPRCATPAIYHVEAARWLQEKALAEEVFGPLGIIVSCECSEQMKDIAQKLDGQLTCTIHITPNDRDVVADLLRILERKAGRLIVNDFPTGVEVADSMVHAGPYPSSTNFGATSVGTLSIRRFLRPVCYQNFPQEFLPGELKDVSFARA
ncbi:aldehyde dehydrogenase (NADP(+)) [Aminobacter sp. SS-2016]|uniref:aldehyde dehydrogenase (NADP(+)) n=1 Tax=Aminobacter sp. Y103A TaxID=1870862 RepID=UPI0025748075|nr:aldehyde dehydrogenase (NADP(+)) [Aminobacter sp. SS-2016]